MQPHHPHRLGYLLLAGVVLCGLAAWTLRPARHPLQDAEQQVLQELRGLGWVTGEVSSAENGRYLVWTLWHSGCASPMTVMVMDGDFSALRWPLGHAGDWQGVRMGGRRYERVPELEYRLVQSLSHWLGVPVSPVYRVSLPAQCFAALPDQ